MGSRKLVRCRTCRSLERTRVLKLFLDRFGLPKKGHSVLHFAPEKGLFDFFRSIEGITYRPVDFEPNNFDFGEVEQFDMCKDASNLENEKYDVIIHSHVLEHVPCNWSAVLLHLHRALSKTGVHFVCIPFLGASYEEDLSRLDGAAAKRRFGQDDHVRKFGKEDISRTLGMLYEIPKEYSLSDTFGGPALISINIPEEQWRGYNLTSVFAFSKADCLFAV